MAKRSQTPPTAEPESPPAVTLDRARRLCRLVRLLGTGSQKRATLLQRLRLDVRGFYRDLEFLRDKLSISIDLEEGRYVLKSKAEAAINKIPLPDPHFTLGEAVQLSKGRTAVHRKLKGLLDEILPS
jgi:hypothetical protein